MTKLEKFSAKIKLAEAAIAHRQNKVEGAAPQVSVATNKKATSLKNSIHITGSLALY